MNQNGSILLHFYILKNLPKQLEISGSIHSVKSPKDAKSQIIILQHEARSDYQTGKSVFVRLATTYLTGNASFSQQGAQLELERA